MLDLTDNTRYNIKLPSGEVLDIKMPTIRRDRQIQDVISLIQSEVSDKIKEQNIYDMLLLIFNDNTNGITFSLEQVQEMLQTKHLLIVLQDYMSYCLSLKKK